MNERIQQLIDEATAREMDLTWGTKSVFDEEKFAQLIIKECAALVQLMSLVSEEDANKLKQHFGIE